MERNLYAPPAAPVADPDQAPADRPKPVAWALWLLWISFGVGLVAPILQYIGVITYGAVLAGLAFNMIRYVVTAWINIKIGQGRNWARILVLLWMIIAVALMAYQWRQYLPRFDGDPLNWLPSDSKIVLDCIALALLFTPSANRWFKP